MSAHLIRAWQINILAWMISNRSGCSIKHSKRSMNCLCTPMSVASTVSSKSFRNVGGAVDVDEDGAEEGHCEGE